MTIDTARSPAVMVADHRPIWRRALMALLASEGFRVVVAEGPSHVGRELRERPDVRVVLASSPVTAAEVADWHGARPDVGIVLVLAEEQHAAIAALLRAGASSCLAEWASVEELMLAVRSAAGGRRHLTPEATEALLGTDSRPQQAAERLTRRQREICSLLTDGRTPKQIAFTLSISRKTVETHRRQIMQRLGVDNVAALVKVAIACGITELRAGSEHHRSVRRRRSVAVGADGEA